MDEKLKEILTALLELAHEARRIPPILVVSDEDFEEHFQAVNDLIEKA